MLRPDGGGNGTGSRGAGAGCCGGTAAATGTGSACGAVPAATAQLLSRSAKRKTSAAIARMATTTHANVLKKMKRSGTSTTKTCDEAKTQLACRTSTEVELRPDAAQYATAIAATMNTAQTGITWTTTSSPSATAIQSE